MEIWKNSMVDSHTNTHSGMTHCCTDSDPLLGCSELTHQAEPTRAKSLLRFYPQFCMPRAYGEQKSTSKYTTSWTLRQIPQLSTKNRSLRLQYAVTHLNCRWWRIFHKIVVIWVTVAILSAQTSPFWLQQEPTELPLIWCFLLLFTILCKLICENPRSTNQPNWDQ